MEMGRLVKLCAVLTAILFAGAITVMGVARLSYHDLLAPYAALRPGQSIDGLKDFPCKFRTTRVKDLDSWGLGYCQSAPNYGVLSEFTLNIKDNTIIQMAAFDIQPGALHLGDLILCWGQPVYIVHNSPDFQASIDLYWKNQLSARGFPVQYRSSLDYFLPITYLSLEPEWKPIDSKALSCA